MYKDITGIILSGGKSSRMGSDKAMLKVGDETIIGRITNLMNSVFSDVFIVTNTPEEYKFLNIPLYEDIHKSKGPLSGIHSGLVHSLTDKNFFISCDLPLISKELIEHIVEFKSDKLIRYCFASGRHHYLAGIYHKDLLPEIERIFASVANYSEKKDQHFSIRNLLENIESETIQIENLSFYKDELFFNLNTHEDFEHLKRISSHH
ncbi:MAG: molybdenum cofactor guanylyltransferase [Ignavibacteriaceae bacterium]|nr:molybdenum cofactor guanylyltransferase [Ignavibacteriaceae bacterium]